MNRYRLLCPCIRNIISQTLGLQTRACKKSCGGADVPKSGSNRSWVHHSGILGGFLKWGYVHPKMGWFIMENRTKMEINILRVPPF